LYSSSQKRGHPLAADALQTLSPDLSQALAGESPRVKQARAQLGTHHLGSRKAQPVAAVSGCAWLIRQRLAFHKHFHFVGVDDFTFEQRLRDAFERIPMFARSFFAFS